MKITIYGWSTKSAVIAKALTTHLAHGSVKLNYCQGLYL